MNVILFGPPGAGKGTQAQFIVKKHNYFQLSTGNLLREEKKLKTSLGAEIEKLISSGKFAISCSISAPSGVFNLTSALKRLPVDN